MYELIKKLCTEKGISPTKLCTEITGSKGNLPTWQKGNINPTSLTKIADYFDVSVDYLLGRTNMLNFDENSKNITNGDINNSTITQASGDNNNIMNNGNELKCKTSYIELLEYLDSLSQSEVRHAVADLMDILEEKYPKKK